MKTLVFLALLLSACPAAPARAQAPADTAPAISLFDSVERIKRFLKDGARQDYSDKYLSGITLRYFDGNPGKGLAWVYSFSFKKPRLGGDVSICHFMNGDIRELLHGP